MVSERLVPERFPELPIIGILHDFLKNKGPLLRLDELAPIRLLSADVDQLGTDLGSTGVEVVGLLATTRRSVGIMLLSGKSGQTALEREEIELRLRALGLEVSTIQRAPTFVRLRVADEQETVVLDLDARTARRGDGPVRDGGSRINQLNRETPWRSESWVLPVAARRPWRSTLARTIASPGS